MRKDGKCENCPDYTMPSNSHNNHSCLPEVCSSRQRIEKRGVCADCPPYTRPTENKQACEPEKCSGFFKNKEDGSCETAQEYEARIIVSRTQQAKDQLKEANVNGGVGAPCEKSESGERRTCAKGLCCGGAEVPLAEGKERPEDYKQREVCGLMT